jgi:hypothetical protein
MGMIRGVRDDPYRVSQLRIMDTRGFVQCSGLGGAVADVRGGSPGLERAGWRRIGCEGTEGRGVGKS